MLTVRMPHSGEVIVFVLRGGHGLMYRIRDGYPVHGRRQGIGDLRVHWNGRRATRVRYPVHQQPSKIECGFWAYVGRPP